MRSRIRRISVREEGFTLSELVVATALMALVVGSIMTLFSTVQRSAVRSETRGRATDEIRLAMESITKDVRQAQTISSSSLASVLDMDTYVNGTATHVTYTASGTTLTRTAGSATRTLLTRLTTTSVFGYTPSVASPTLVSITLTIHPAQFASDAGTVSLTSDARLRNA